MRRAVVAYIERGGLLLSIPRPDGKHAAPGGKVAAGESDEAALARELDEETGLSIARAWVVYRGYCNGFAVAVYRVEPLGEPVAREPGTRIEWVSAEALATGFGATMHRAALEAAGFLSRLDLASHGVSR